MENNITKSRRESLNNSSHGTPRKLSISSKNNSVNSKLSDNKLTPKKLSAFAKESPDNYLNQKKLSNFFAIVPRRSRISSPRDSIKSGSVTSPKENLFAPLHSKHQSKQQSKSGDEQFPKHKFKSRKMSKLWEQQNALLQNEIPLSNYSKSQFGDENAKKQSLDQITSTNHLGSKKKNTEDLVQIISDKKHKKSSDSFDHIKSMRNESNSSNE